MVEVTEDARLITDPDETVLDRPQSSLWKLRHGIFYMIGGLTFISGSCMYFPSVSSKYSSALIIGGWLFTIGSLFFLFADLQEWWYYRIGCCFDHKYRSAFEVHNANYFHHSKDTFGGRFERAEVGINFFISVCGSTLYLAGSILFIPKLQGTLSIGDWLFIIGSAFIIVSQGWKVYRSACINKSDRNDHRFRISNLSNDFPAFGVDGFAGLGGVFYFIGTILFLPPIYTVGSISTISAILFVCGGTCFTLSGFFLQYRYHFADQN